MLIRLIFNRPDPEEDKNAQTAEKQPDAKEVNLKKRYEEKKEDARVKERRIKVVTGKLAAYMIQFNLIQVGLALCAQIWAESSQTKVLSVLDLVAGLLIVIVLLKWLLENDKAQEKANRVLVTLIMRLNGFHCILSGGLVLITFGQFSPDQPTFLIEGIDKFWSELLLVIFFFIFFTATICSIYAMHVIIDAV